MFVAWANPLQLETWIHNPILALITVFQIWMAIDAIRRQEYVWAVFIVVFWGISSVLYFLQVYRVQGPAGGGGLVGFELPGAGNRRRIKELTGRIHYLDHARDHLDLADVYFSQGKLAQAENSYRDSLKRDATDPDASAHLGQCLLRQGRVAEAKPLLEQVLKVDPRHDYGHTQMALAETLTQLGDREGAKAIWERVLGHNNYARARVQLGELLIQLGDVDHARQELREAITDDAHLPKYQRGRDRIWIRRAKTALRTLG
jgi:hypothetical protein